MNIRLYQPSDRPQVERLCVENGLRGHLDDYFKDPEIFAKLWLAPFLDGEPDATWVAEENGQVFGYLVAAIRPGFKFRALRCLVPHVYTLVLNFVTGKYRGDPVSVKFVKWFLTQSWREVPRHAKESSNFHFNVAKSARGELRLGEQLMNAFFAELRRRGVQHFHIHVFGSAGKRDLKFYRSMGFRIGDTRVSKLFAKPTLVASLENEVPDANVDYKLHRSIKMRSISVVITASNAAQDLPNLLLDLRNQALPPDEVVIVCNHCSDDTERIARSSRATVVHGEFSHCAEARMAGIRAATGQVLLILDASMRIGVDLIAEVARASDAGFDSGIPYHRPDENHPISRLWVAGLNRLSLDSGDGSRAFFANKEMGDSSWPRGDEVNLTDFHPVRPTCRVNSTVVVSCRHFRQNGHLIEFLRSLRNEESKPLEPLGQP